MEMSESGRRFDPFRKLDEVERKEHLASYLEFLRKLDGEVDVEARTLSRRELRFEALGEKRPESSADSDLGIIREQLGVAVRRPVDRRTAWLVVAAKANTGESYGVEEELRWIRDAGAIPTADELYLRMLMQEGYHTRLLLECCRTAGLEDFTLPLPAWNQRFLIHVIMRLPDSIRWSLVICAEIVGCVVFGALLKNLDVFSDEPDVEARLRELITEIQRDEALHVAFLRARLGPRALGLARRMSKWVARGAILDFPQLKALGVRRDAVLEAMRAGVEIPAEADWMVPDYR